MEEVTTSLVERTASAGCQTLCQLFQVAWKVKYGTEEMPDGKLRRDVRRFRRRQRIPCYVRELVATAIQY